VRALFTWLNKKMTTNKNILIESVVWSVLEEDKYGDYVDGNRVP
jgi:hypothetical protein